MKKLLLVIMISLFSISTLLADPIEGGWQVDEPKMKKLLLSVKEDDQAILIMLLLSVKKMVFYNNGKVTLPNASMAGSWKKRAKDYLVIVDEDKIFAYMDKGILKLKPPVDANFSAPIILKRHTAPSPEMIAKDKKIEAIIQYDRKYQRIKKNPDGSSVYLIISHKNKKCSFISHNIHGSGSSTTSDSCSVFNGYLQMGGFLGKAEVLSANKIKVGKNMYILQK